MRTRILKGCLIWLTISALTSAALGHAASRGPVSFHFLDVGQGDALLIHQPGTCAALVDAGSPINGYKVTAKLQELQIDTLDLVIITHPHLDHLGGLFDIVPRTPVIRFYDNGATNKAWEYFDDYNQLRLQLDHGVLQRGDVLTCGPVTIKVLYPNRLPTSSDDLNSDSLAMLIHYAGTRLLHMGDLAGPGATDFLRLGDVLAAEILKVAHHGASDAAPGKLIDEVSPNYAIISTAQTNRIDSPAEEVLERLTAAGITVLRTDRDGSLHFSLDHSGYRLLTP